MQHETHALRERDRPRLVLLCAVHGHLLAEPGRVHHARGDARAHLVRVLGPREDRCARPEHVRGDRVRVALCPGCACQQPVKEDESSRTLTSAVSRKRSATRVRKMCTSFLATSVKRMRDATSSPAHSFAERIRGCSPAAGKRSSQRTLRGTLRSIRSQTRKMPYMHKQARTFSDHEASMRHESPDRRTYNDNEYLRDRSARERRDNGRRNGQ